MSAPLWALVALVALAMVLIALVVIVRGPSALAGLLAPAVRRWLYAVAAGVLVLLTGYGVMTDSLASLWDLVLAALLGVARHNVPSSSPANSMADVESA